MLSGSRRKRGSDEYIFIDGKAMKSEEAIRIDVAPVAAPGQEETAREARHVGKARQVLRDMDTEDAFTLREGAISSLAHGGLLEDERRKMRRKYVAFGVILLVAILFSLCISSGYYWKLYTPAEVINSWGTQINLMVMQVVNPQDVAQARAEALAANPMYLDVCMQVLKVFKYVVAGIMLALSGMLYQNAFRNPIAAPSMLGVSNGMSMALLVLVLQFGYAASSMVSMYFIYSYVGGALMLLLVLFGGKWMSGKGRFNVVNMILVGTIASQLIGVIMTFVQANFLSEADWEVYYLLSTATTAEGIWTYVSLMLGIIVSLVPIFVFRFRLNLISFDDAETRLLGVDPGKLRMLALGCGSLMILTAQVNTGQVAMASLVVPFVVRAVFGAEFRKQLVGNILVGALIILLCGDLVSIVCIDYIPIDLGSVVTICAMPLFVWMLAIRQRSWE